jgi:hypothetical protein
MGKTKKYPAAGLLLNMGMRNRRNDIFRTWSRERRSQLLPERAQCRFRFGQHDLFAEMKNGYICLTVFIEEQRR